MSQVGDLNIFLADEDALAEEVNDNFSDIKSAHNDTDTSVSNILNNALTINGAKTFSAAASFSSTVSASTAPTLGSHLTNKTYVDAQIAAITTDASDVDVTPAGTISSTNVQSALQELDTDIQGKAASVHTHDDRYYTETEMDSFLGAKSNTGHTHTSSDITDFNEAAQDAVGNALVDGTTINFTYTDGSNQITAEVQNLTSSNISDFNEAAQDAVGSILTDSSTIDFTYTDGSNQITASVKWLNGVTGSRPGSPTTGEMYFDTTIGKPIWYSGSGWVLADGTSA